MARFPPDFQTGTVLTLLRARSRGVPWPEKIRFSFGDGGRIGVPPSTCQQLILDLTDHVVNRRCEANVPPDDASIRRSKGV